MMYRAAGNIRAIQILFDHSKIDIIGRHCDIESALLPAGQTEDLRMLYHKQLRIEVIGRMK